VLVEIVDPGVVREEHHRPGVVSRRLVTPQQQPPAEDFEPRDDMYYRSEARVRGPGWQNLPVDVQFVFADGIVVRDRWDGHATWRAYRFLRRAPLREVRLDPDDKLVVDVLPANNGRRVAADYTIATDWSWWLTSAVQWLAAGGALWL
jgi:hypothetical protein